MKTIEIENRLAVVHSLEIWEEMKWTSWASSSRNAPQPLNHTLHCSQCEARKQHTHNATQNVSNECWQEPTGYRSLPGKPGNLCLIPRVYRIDERKEWTPQDVLWPPQDSLACRWLHIHSSLTHPHSDRNSSSCQNTWKSLICCVCACPRRGEHQMTSPTAWYLILNKSLTEYRVHWFCQTSLLASPRNPPVSCSPGITAIHCCAWRSHLPNSNFFSLLFSPAPSMLRIPYRAQAGLKLPSDPAHSVPRVLTNQTQLGFLYMLGRKQYMYFLNDNHPWEHTRIINHTWILPRRKRLTAAGFTGPH